MADENVPDDDSQGKRPEDRSASDDSNPARRWGAPPVRPAGAPSFGRAARQRPRTETPPRPEQNARVPMRKPRPVVLAGVALVLVAALGVGGMAWFSKPSAPFSEPLPAVEVAETFQEGVSQPDQPARQAPSDQVPSTVAQLCTPMVSGLEKQVTLGSSYERYSTADETGSDHGATQVIAGLLYEHPDVRLKGAGIIFAAPVDGRCEGNAVRVVPLSQPCDQVAGSRATQGASQPPQILSGLSLYAFPGSDKKVMLIPAAGNTCIVVSVLRNGKD